RTDETKRGRCCPERIDDLLHVQSSSRTAFGLPPVGGRDQSRHTPSGRRGAPRTLLTTSNVFARNRFESRGFAACADADDPCRQRKMRSARSLKREVQSASGARALNSPHAPRFIICERLLQLFPRVHDEG